MNFPVMVDSKMNATNVVPDLLKILLLTSAVKFESGELCNHLLSPLEAFSWQWYNMPIHELYRIF